MRKYIFLYKKFIFLGLLFLVNYAVIFYTTLYVDGIKNQLVLINILPLIGYVYLGWLIRSYCEGGIVKAILFVILISIYDKVFLKTLYVIFLYYDTDYSIFKIIGGKIHLYFYSAMYMFPVYFVACIIGMYLRNKKSRPDEMR